MNISRKVAAFKEKAKKNRIGKLRRQAHATSKIEMQKNPKLWETLQEYLAKTNVAGCSYTDYWTLYQYVRTHKPLEILECGPGVSTVVMAHALMENEAEGMPKGRITAMEDQQTWYDLAREILPKHLMPYVDLCLSPRRDFCFSLFRGVGYAEIPDRPYQVVFIDGPNTLALSDNSRTFDFDFIRVVLKSKQPVTGIIDKRLSTVFAMQHIFGDKHVVFDPIKEFTFCGPFKAEDVKALDKSKSFFWTESNGRFYVDFDIQEEKTQHENKKYLSISAAEVEQ